MGACVIRWFSYILVSGSHSFASGPTLFRLVGGYCSSAAPTVQRRINLSYRTFFFSFLPRDPCSSLSFRGNAKGGGRETGAVRGGGGRGGGGGGLIAETENTAAKSPKGVLGDIGDVICFTSLLLRKPPQQDPVRCGNEGVGLLAA